MWRCLFVDDLIIYGQRNSLQNVIIRIISSKLYHSEFIFHLVWNSMWSPMNVWRPEFVAGLSFRYANISLRQSWPEGSPDPGWCLFFFFFKVRVNWKSMFWISKTLHWLQRRLREVCRWLFHWIQLGFTAVTMDSTEDPESHTVL